MKAGQPLIRDGEICCRNASENASINTSHEESAPFPAGWPTRKGVDRRSWAASRRRGLLPRQTGSRPADLNSGEASKTVGYGGPAFERDETAEHDDAHILAHHVARSIGHQQAARPRMKTVQPETVLVCAVNHADRCTARRTGISREVRAGQLIQRVVGATPAAARIVRRRHVEWADQVRGHDHLDAALPEIGPARQFAGEDCGRGPVDDLFDG